MQAASRSRIGRGWALVGALLLAAAATRAGAATAVRNGDFEAGAQAWSQLGPVICGPACQPPEGYGPATGTGWAWLYGGGATRLAQGDVTIPPAHVLKFQRARARCLGGTFSAHFISAGVTTTLLSEALDELPHGCDEGYEARRIDLRSLAGRTGTLEFRLDGGVTPDGGLSEIHLDDVAFEPLVARGDFNGDRLPDLLLVDRSDPACATYEAWFMEDARRLDSRALVNVCSPTTLFGGSDDFTGDGQSDLLYLRTLDGAAVIYEFDGAGLLGTRVVTGAPALGPDWRIAATGDFNGDGWADVVWRNTLTQQLRIRTLQAGVVTGELVPTPERAVDAQWNLVGAQDFNGDGARDLLWYNPTSGRIVFWFMDANLRRITGQFANPPSAGNANWRVVATADYGVGPNGLADTADVVWQNADSGNLVIWYMDRAGNRTSGVFTTPSAPAAPSWKLIGPR